VWKAPSEKEVLFGLQFRWQNNLWRQPNGKVAEWPEQVSDEVYKIVAGNTYTSYDFRTYT
jgi:hypothetical protein